MTEVIVGSTSNNNGPNCPGNCEYNNDTNCWRDAD